jgi:outer membrane protein
MRLKLFVVLFFSSTVLIFAQTDTRLPLSLEACISLAIEHNLDLKSSELAKQSRAINFNQSKNALLPNINGNYNIGLSNGRSIDPFTNGITNQELIFSNAGLGLDATIFNGFRLINSWKQAKLNLEASEMDVEAAKQLLVLNVTLTYLQVLNAQDLVRLAQSRLQTTQGQLDRLKSLYEEETGNPAEYRDLQGQLAMDAANIAETKNTLETELINLNTLVNAEEAITVAPLNMEIDFETYLFSAEAVYQKALEVFPSVKASDLSLAAAEKAVSVAKSQYIPEISLFANLNTNFSSAARLFNDLGTSIVETGNFVNIDNQAYSVFTEQTSFSSSEIPYRDQFDNNLNSSVGVSVSIPIFNGFRAKNNVALEKIKKAEARTALEQTKLDLKQAVNQSYNAMQTAFQRYDLLQDQVEAYEESFRINEIRFNNGVSNSVAYIISKNNLDTAQINLANVKYEYALRVKVLAYYQNKI